MEEETNQRPSGDPAREDDHMGLLSVADHSAILHAIDRAVAAGTVEELREIAIAEVANLIECVSCSWTEVNLETGLTYGAMNQDVDPGRISQEMARVIHQHPVINRFRETGEGSARAISDLISRGKFQALDLYRKFYRKYQTEDQLSISALFEGRWLLGLVVNRASWGFTPREKALLNTLRGPFFRTFGHLKKIAELSLARDGLASLKDNVEVLKESLLQRGLTPREAEVLAWITQGRSNGEIAEILGVSEGTIRKHVERVFKALHVTNRAAAVHQALARYREINP
jgi:DNA-binding CsgD family transcriptional regulator